LLGGTFLGRNGLGYSLVRECIHLKYSRIYS
jgi:hypothetical protein